MSAPDVIERSEPVSADAHLCSLDRVVMPHGGYRTILADPPWDYAGKTPPWRSTSEQTYDLMPLQEICDLPVGQLASGDAHLYLWAVLPMMREAYEVVEAWGFTPETMLTWCKPGVGLGGGWRGG